MFAALLVIGQQVAGKAVRDTLFLANFPATRLPLVMAAAAGVCIVGILVLARLMARWPPSRIVPVIFVGSAVMFVLEWLVHRVAPTIVAVSAYLHVAALGVTAVSAFWSLLNERFDPYAAKSVFAKIASAATAGGVLGGMIAWSVAVWLDLPLLLIALATSNLVCAWCMRRIGANHQERVSVRGPSGSAEIFRKVPYLRHLGALMAFGALSDVTIDYLFKAQARVAYLSDDSLLGFFSLFHMVVAIGTFALQTAFAQRALQRFGLTTVISVLPGFVVVGAAAAFIIPGLWSIAALRGGSTALRNSLFRSGYELLYTPLSPGKKRPTKVLIDVGASKLGGGVASCVVVILLWALPAGVVTAVLLGIAVAAGAIALVITSWLHRGYVAALADSLRSGAIDLREEPRLDATTRQTLSDTFGAINRTELLAKIASLRDQTQPAFARAGHDLEQVRTILKRVEHDASLIPRVVTFLADEKVMVETVVALRKVATEASECLIDSLNDPNTDAKVRARIPRVLRVCATQSVADGLLRGLSDTRSDVRYRCGVALLRITETNPEIVIPKQVIFDAAKREAERGEHIWQQQERIDKALAEAVHPFADEASVRRVGRKLAHVFTILAIVLDREPIQLAFRALASQDSALRGTGLEYLVNVVPESILTALSSYLGDQRVTSADR